MSEDWLALGIYHLQHRSACGDHAAAAVLDEIVRLRSLAENDIEHAHHLDTDAPLYDASHFVGATCAHTQYTQTMTNEVLR
jgi:hypothetical protein